MRDSAEFPPFVSDCVSFSFFARVEMPPASDNPEL